MFKNYIKIALRNLWKNKIFSLINIVSLAIGLSASIVIGMIVYYDFTFDKFHPDGDRIYRVASKYQDPEGTSFFAGIPIPLIEEVDKNYTGIEESAYIFMTRPYSVLASKEDAAFKEPKFVTYTDENYFNIFKYDWLAGSGENQLLNPNEVVLTQSRAAQYFPNKNPAQLIGKTLIYNDSLNATVTGIVADFKERTDLVFQEFISLKTIKQTDQNGQFLNPNWQNVNSSSQLFIKLEEGTDTTILQNQLNQTALAHEDPEDKKYNASREFYAQPLSELHFDQRYGNFDYTTTTADKDVMFMLGCIALFLLLLGCVNFINLNTAQASQRAKEIGIRKTLGSSKKQLITQFLGETFLLTVVAGIVSLGLSVWLIYIFKDFIADGVSFEMLLDPYLIGFLCLLIICVTLLSGFYPGVVLSKFKAAKVLKGENKSKDGKIGLRKFLTVFQFTIAYIFIIATLLVGKQIQYLLNMDLGFQTDSIVYVETPDQIEGINSRELLAEKLKTIPQLSKVSIGNTPPTSSTLRTVFKHEGKDGEKVMDISVLFGDTNYLDLYDISLITGRLPINDTIKEVVINETAVRDLGFKTPEEALNKIVNPNQSPMQITGVMKDFHSGSLKYEIEPVAFTGDIYRKYFSQFGTLHMNIQAGSGEKISNTLELIQSKFDEVYPDSNSTINFMDETVANFYKKERSTSNLLNWAMGLSVLISCLGLLGLVMFNTERRIKEIGIRKVLGASVVQLNTLLCKDFLWLIGIAFLIAAPIAYWGLNNWLQDFATRTEFSWWIFAGSGLGMIALAIIIMSFKTISAALENPVKNLKIE
ncbi:ABC-type antimicrobial peptide transport system permease subunit [Nonlabens dokdonensis]|uniref:ABC-type antimicrobial peptide transport system permease subunit n=2 Tax=Nonlabens dokdonensis TaxID=328515 RepID=A0ABX5PXM5_9FLAO|nr:FtsX-like permease family protein [Nonlabens dokdonensis]AGC77656.1 putative FtsX-related transmembrane transport protein [Nonlabens dokdonensis DSW-6]PZX39801.1 ABC-type antimicrobial peptide transport system permease subunit [Nonlabens dokdonensis]